MAGHPLGAVIRHEAAKEVEMASGELGAGLVVEGSAGRGNWAAVPWVSVFDPTITTSATHGYYVVYLFHVNESLVHLSLNQGTTAVREEFRERAREILRDRADLMRKRIAEFADILPINKIDLGSEARLPGDYAAGHARLRFDLQTIVRAYRALAYRGGIDADMEGQPNVADDFALTRQMSVTETRKYAYHRKVERNRTAARCAKTFHGNRCQACDLNFAERYGDIRDGFIEVHHLRPIAILEEGVAVRYDVVEDFAVLCSNCHRMIHRYSDPSDLATFRTIIRK